MGYQLHFLKENGELLHPAAALLLTLFLATGTRIFASWNSCMLGYSSIFVYCIASTV
jgi:hypothetical protein